MKSKLSVLVLVVVLMALAATPIAASPLAGPCAPGAAYNLTCDVNQDGAVNVLDVQLTAGHWNQTGTFTSDNNHLGQTWTGSTNSLTIQGAFGAPSFAVMTLNNTAGHGLAINSATLDGIYIGSADYYGMVVNHAGLDGVYVGTAGSPSSNPASTASNGFEVAGAQGHGLFVGRADQEGVHVNSTGGNGVYVDSTGSTGFTVYTAGSVGFNVHSAGGDGVDVFGSAYAGNFLGNIYVSGNCIGCLQANFAVNAGGRALEPGDVVSIHAVTPTDFDTGSTLWKVVQAQPGQSLPPANAGAVVGGVAGRAELVTEEEHRPSETGKRLIPKEGAAQPGEYVTIVYSGPMQVKVAPGKDAITAGTRLTAAADGRVRPLGTIKVQLAGSEGTADMLESAPVIGVALEAAKDGMVWVLVNPQ